MDRNGPERLKQPVIQFKGACDICKKRKIRCDRRQMPGTRCTHCATYGLDCTYADLEKTLTSTNGYVTALEIRVEKMERLLTKLLPGIDFTEQLESESEVKPLLQRHAETLPRNDHDLKDGLTKLKISPECQRFYGKSSGIQFVQTAFNFNTHLTGIAISQLRGTMPSLKRDEFWTINPWLLPPPGEEDPKYSFPEEDLLPILVDLYFAEINPFWPVLHRPTFERKIADNLHLRDHRFGSTVLMVCSLGARHSDDRRVLLDDAEDHDFRSAGWKWHSQVRVIPKHLIYKPDLYELQAVALSALYLQVLPPTAVCWTQVGFGLRRAHDVGAHRRRNQDHPTAESEQWKRVFWVLLCLDWMAGTYTGRPLAMHHQDFDQDLPVDCDDEYWDLPEPRNFKQPKDEPSQLSYFVCYARLLEIQAAVATTIYSPRKPKDLSGRSFPPTEAQCIMALDSALNAWLNGIPEHLRWDPARENLLHFHQSALLYAAYYNVQILVHRPFIPAPFEASPPGALPSLVICNNAARSCVRIFDAYERRGIQAKYNILPVAFAAAIVLLLSAWSGKKSDFAYNPSKELDQFHSCLRIMKEVENKYIGAGRYTDMLNRLLYARVDSLFCDFLPLSIRQRLDGSPKPVHHRVEDFETASDQLHATFNSQLPLEHQYRENDADWSSFDGAFTHLAQMCGPTNIDMPPFPVDMAVNTDFMAMWPTAPSGFHVDDWSYFMSDNMSGQQFDQFSSGSGQASLYGETDRLQTYFDPTEAERLRWEMSRYFGTQ